MCCQHLDVDGAERDWRTYEFTATTVEFRWTDRNRAALVSKEGIYNRKSGERMLGQDNPLSDRRNCWHSFHTERRFEMNQGRAERAASRLLISITETWNKELRLRWKSALLWVIPARLICRFWTFPWEEQYDQMLAESLLVRNTLSGHRLWRNPDKLGGASVLIFLNIITAWSVVDQAIAGSFFNISAEEYAFWLPFPLSSCFQAYLRWRPENKLSRSH